MNNPAHRRTRDVGLPAPVRGHALRTLSALVAVAAFTGCAQTGAVPEVSVPPSRAPAAQPGMPANVEPPAPSINLSGFPLPYRQGYADGCASAGGVERKDAARYGTDGNYRTGWLDGQALCRRK